MKLYRCPTCNKILTKREYERALKIEGAKKAHLQHLEAELKKKEQALPERIEAAREEAKQKERRRTARLMAGKEEETSKLKERIRQLKRGTTPQTEGLEFEDKLVARLHKEFPGDSVQHKGKGGDVLHVVRFGGSEVGIIVYECKRTPKILPQHIRQAYLAKQSRDAHDAVLVTTGKKRGFGGLTQINGVWVVFPLVVMWLAHLLRETLIEMSRSGVTEKERATIARRLVKYVTSPQFKNPIEEVVKSSSELQTMVREEAVGHLRAWRKRLSTYRKIQLDSTLIKENLQLVLHGKEPKAIKMPKLPLLQLPPTLK